MSGLHASGGGRPLILIGASGLAREVIPVLRDTGRNVVGILDDSIQTLPRTISGIPVVGDVEDVALFPDDDLLICVGSGSAREAIVQRLDYFGVERSRFTRVADPSVRNPAGCPIGAGSILLAGVVITADAVVGEHVVAMPGVTITHDCLVEDYATLTAGVSLAGAVVVGSGAYLGMNATVRQGVRIGAGAVIGMGAAVLTDVPAGETWAGVPARRLEVRA